MNELKPKFREGNIVSRNNNKPTASFDSIKNSETVEIRKIERLMDVYFYGVTKTNVLDDNIWFPQSEFDSMYDLNVIYSRRLKLKKILDEIQNR